MSRLQRSAGDKCTGGHPAKIYREGPPFGLLSLFLFAISFTTRGNFFSVPNAPSRPAAITCLRLEQRPRNLHVAHRKVPKEKRETNVRLKVTCGAGPTRGVDPGGFRFEMVDRNGIMAYPRVTTPQKWVRHKSRLRERDRPAHKLIGPCQPQRRLYTNIDSSTLGMQRIQSGTG